MYDCIHSRCNKSLGIYVNSLIFDVNGRDDITLSLIVFRRGRACSGVVDLMALLRR